MQNFRKSFIKTLTESDINPNVSNQHELHGVSKLKSIFGINDTKCSATIRFGHQGDKYPINITWYDSRANNPDRSAEYRLYYDNPIMQNVQAGDDIMIGLTTSDEIEIIIFVNQQSGYNSWTECP